MKLCSNRPEGFGPESHLYSHILTSCFLDTILVPLCTWFYLLALVTLFLVGARRSNSGGHIKHSVQETGEHTGPRLQRGRARNALSILYYLFLLAQFLMCILEIVRLSLAHLEIGLLPFTFVTLIFAGFLRFTRGGWERVPKWRWANMMVWVFLAVSNGVKIAEETKEGTNARKGSKYPVSDEITDVSVMIGVYIILLVLEALVPP